MTLEEAVYAVMAANAGIDDLVDDRIYPGSIPQDVALPAIAYAVTDHETWLTHSGPSGLARSLVQLTIAAEDYSALKAVNEAVKACWSGFVGTIANTFESFRISLAKVETIADIDVTQLERALGQTVDISIIHEEH